MKKTISWIVTGICLMTVLPLSAAEEKKSAKQASAEKKTAGAGDKAGSSGSVLGTDLTSAQRTKLMEMLNKGDEAALTSLPGVGPTRAKAIIKARPLKDVAALQSVPGLGEATVSDIVAHAKAGFPGNEKAETDSTKSKPQSEGKAKAESKSKPKAKAKAKAKEESKP
jgi:Holliday junction resolvasome RuvABC DNA-binding subunit